MIKINKNKAKRLFEEGRTIGMIPCKMRLDNPWQGIFWIKNTEELTFEQHVNSCAYYNCTSETGNRLHFYVKNEEEQNEKI